MYLTPPTTEITDHTNHRNVTTTLDTGATVTDTSAVYDRGVVLRNQPVYLSGVAPQPNVSATTTTSNGGMESVSHRFTLVYTATRNERPFWERTEPVATGTSTRHGRTTTTASVPVADLRTRLETYRAEFGRAGAVSLSIRLTVEYTTGPYERTFVETYPVTFGDGWYGLSSDTIRETHTTPVTHTRTLPVETRLTFLLPLGLGGGLLLAELAGLVVRRRVDATGDGLVDDVHRERYGEWISEGELAGADPASVVRMGSLEALVDVAIDSKKAGRPRSAGRAVRRPRWLGPVPIRARTTPGRDR